MAKLAPKRYILVTSRSLSPREKDTLLEILATHCPGESEVIRAEDLNALLRKYPEIEKAHYKLWIASSSVLEAVLHNDLFSRSYQEIEDIKTRISLFVPTNAVTRAMELLESRGFCLLSGVPGIGKTTTAEMLVAVLLEDGWECICVSANASEAQRVYKQKQRQVFYYDDFLGQTSHTEKLGKNEDHELARLIRSCSKHPKSKRLILTTRNYLLAEAVENHEVLTRADIGAGTCVVELGDYTPQVRAQILVSHLWFYGVKEVWCRKLVESGVARRIVDHENYNPRLIEALCNRALGKGQTATSFAKNSLALLDDPTDLWRHPYQNQLSDAGRELLVCFASLGSGCYLNSLRIANSAFAVRRDNDLLSGQRFNRALRELEGTFVQVESIGGERVVTYHNPSVKDFMDNVFSENPECWKRVLSCATHYEQLDYAIRYALSTNPSVEVATLLCDALHKLTSAESAVPDGLYGDVLEDTDLRPARRLLTLRGALRQSTPASIKACLCRIAIEYLNSGNYEHDTAEDVSELVRKTAGDESELGLEIHLDHKRVLRWLWPNLRYADDFVAMQWWVDGWEENNGKTEVLEKLRAKFVDTAGAILDDFADGYHSASDIREGISDILDAAEQLRVDKDEIDTFAAESAYDEREQEEEREAETKQEEWNLKYMEERAEREQVNDILDSLR